jgi:cystathionine beta-lyase/cystathionine gamma-synthase
LFLLETPSNPLGEVVDIAALSKISQTHDILLAVDNATMPDAVATQACAPSSAANFLSKASTVGLVKRA